LGKFKFTDINSVVVFSKNYLINRMNNKEIRISLSEFIFLIDKIGNDKFYNKHLYDMIRKESGKYNLVSKKYINKYTD
jgi:hypothetical protein